MKKLFALLLILVSSHMFGQVIVHNQPVKLKQLVLGTSADSLVVVDADGLTKYLPSSSLGGTFSGSIAANQVAYGSGPDAIQGSANFTYDGSEVATDSLTVNNGIKLGYASQTGLGKGAIWRNGVPWLFATADNEAFSQNIFLGENAGGNYALHGTGTEPNDGGNVGLGAWSMNQMGAQSYQNTAVGTWSLEYMTTGDWNTGVGAGAMYSNTTGGSNTGVGRNVASAFTTGSNNSFFGKNAGLFYTGNVNLTTVNNGVFIGSDTKAFANSSSNEIVIGYNATGKGNNTATIGNGSITKIAAGADFVPVNAEDLVTKGYADATYAGGGGTIGGSIGLNQVAYGSGVNAIQGSANFTYDGTALGLVTADILTTGDLGSFGTPIGDSYTNALYTSYAESEQTYNFNKGGGFVVNSLGTGSGGNDISWYWNTPNAFFNFHTDLYTLMSGDFRFNETIATIDGRDVKSLVSKEWVEAKIAGGGGGTIGGTIADNQIAVGNGTDAIDGSADLTYDGNLKVSKTASGAAMILDRTDGSSMMVQAAGGGGNNIAYDNAGFFNFTPQSTVSIGNGQITDLSAFNFTLFPNQSIRFGGAHSSTPLADDTYLFNGTVTADNLSGTNTGDQDLTPYATKSLSPVFTGVSYTTNTTDNGDHIVMTGGTTITLDDTNVTVGDQFYFVNQTGSDLTFAFGGGSSAYQGAPSTLADGLYAWATLQSANLWSISVPGAGGGGDVFLASSNVFTGASQTFQGASGVFVQNGNNNSGGTSLLYIGAGNGFTHSMSGVATELQLSIGSGSEPYIFNGSGTTNANDVVTKAYGDANYTGVTDIVVGGFNNPISVGGATTKTLTYDRDVPLILGSTAQTPTADNFTGVMFVNNTASTLALTVDGTYAPPLGFQFSANKFGTGDITITPTNGATINGSTGVVTITTQYEGTVQLIHISGDDYLMVGKL